MERWSVPSGGGGTLKLQIQQQQLAQALGGSTYNTIDETGKEYEEMPDCFYDQRTLNRRSQVVASPLPPQPPPTTAMRGTLRPTHLAIHHQKEKQPAWRNIGMAAAMGMILLMMVLALIMFLMMGSRGHHHYSLPGDKEASSGSSGFTFGSHIHDDSSTRQSEMEITPNHLLTLMMTKRKICLFEASTDNNEQSEEFYNSEHIESARLLIHSNLSRSGVPVHPLQFQRYTRMLGVDSDCHIVLYDRGQMIWATYSAWILKLFGHRKVSLLSGGWIGWKAAQSRSPQYRTESGPAPAVTRQGDFSASWNESTIITFDDVFVNTEMTTYDVVDAQAKEEFEGTAPGALYGHIRGAVNIPIDTVFDYSASRWRPQSDMAEIFRRAGLTHNRPVIIYCSTSVRSSLVWWALSRLGFNSRIYFGGWPEWVIRAPDYLKVLVSNN